jgi:uncharacterized protein (DUF433 family)
VQTWLSDRISFDPTICHGKPVVRGTRVLVANVVGGIASGQSIQDILQDYPSLKELDIRACLELAGNRNLN